MYIPRKRALKVERAGIQVGSERSAVGKGREVEERDQRVGRAEGQVSVCILHVKVYDGVTTQAGILTLVIGVVFLSEPPVFLYCCIYKHTHTHTHVSFRHLYRHN